MTKGQNSWSEDQSVRVGILIGVVVWFLAIGLLLLNWNTLPPQIPWFYSLPWGEEQLVPKNWLIAIVVSFGGIMLLNTLLARVLGNDEELLRRILVWGGVAVEVLILLSLVRVIMVIL